MDAFEAYQRKFHQAMAELPSHEPWREAGRGEIRGIVRRVLGIRDDWVPGISADAVRVSSADGFTIEHLSFRSWPDVFGAAHLYLPAEAEPRRPVVFLACGHGFAGRFEPTYQAMARRIVRHGAAVLVPDPIGHGEREAMGHAHAYTPFACGTSLQGLIVLETMGWLNWLRQDERFDPQRIALIGNSGGGTLALFMGVLCPDLAALASTGYPSTFEFVARKEKIHCACNILPGIAGRLEMAHALGCVAPRPLLLMQGRHDNLFPEDLFRHTARQVEHAYRMAHSPPGRLRVHVEGDALHPWTPAEERVMVEFLRQPLRLNESPDLTHCPAANLQPEGNRVLERWPDSAINTAELARRLTGKRAPDDIALPDIFRPTPDLDPADSDDAGGRQRVILAQFEAFLKPQSRSAEK